MPWTIGGGNRLPFHKADTRNLLVVRRTVRNGRRL